MSGSQFYTRRGDNGFTGVLGPERVPKYDSRPEAYGTVDEAQAALGLARASSCTAAFAQIVLVVQRDMYTLMAELAAAGDAGSPFSGKITAFAAPLAVGAVTGLTGSQRLGISVSLVFLIAGLLLLLPVHARR